MRTKNIFVLMAFVVLVFTSCDSNKGKVKDLADQFVIAFNEDDKAGINELFPQINEFDNLQMGPKIKGEDRNVDKDEETGRYIITIDEKRNQRLVFEADSAGEIHMVDSYGVFRLDTLSNELALSTGVPLKKISDLDQAKLMKQNSYYLQYLKDLPAVQNNMSLTAWSGAYSWRTGYGSYVMLNFSITNNGALPVPGSDYYLMVDIKVKSTGASLTNQKTVDGVDIAPGETREFNVHADEVIRYAVNKNISYFVSVKYRCESDIEMLLKFGKFTGKEYDEYVKEDKETEYMLREKGVEMVAKSANEKVVYVHENSDENSAITDTLYHRQQIYVTYSDTFSDTTKWVKAYSMEYKYLGYIQVSEQVSTEELSPVWYYTLTTYSEDGSDIPIYNDETFEGTPVKRYKNGTELTAYYDDETDANAICERMPDGSMKKIGYIKMENINEENMED